MSDVNEALHIEISYRNLKHSDAVNEHVHGEIDRFLRRFAERLTRIEVHLSDVNEGKSGPDDKRCMMEARPKGLDPMVAEHHAEDLYAAIDGAAKKLQRVLDSKLR
ncbi:MAG: ribosome-associated translation inhibitor RaiA [Planctomycetota bacterium]